MLRSKKPIKVKNAPVITSKHGSFELPSTFGYRKLNIAKKCITDAKDECFLEYQIKGYTYGT